MIKLDDMIGDVIFISFHDTKRLHEIGIKESAGHYMLKGFDRLGLWLEHPGIHIKHMEDENGHPLPPGKQSHEEVDAIFIAHWENVNTIMYYPNREGFDFPNQFKKKIGFRFKDKLAPIKE